MRDFVCFREFGNGVVVVSNSEPFILNDIGKYILITLWVVREVEKAYSSPHQGSSKQKIAWIMKRVESLGPTDFVSEIKKLMMHIKDERNLITSDYIFHVLKKAFSYDLRLQDVKEFVDTLVEVNIIDSN